MYATLCLRKKREPAGSRTRCESGWVGAVSTSSSAVAVAGPLPFAGSPAAAAVGTARIQVISGSGSPAASQRSVAGSSRTTTRAAGCSRIVGGEPPWPGNIGHKYLSCGKNMKLLKCQECGKFINCLQQIIVHVGKRYSGLN